MNWGREKPRRARSCFCWWREDGDRVGEGVGGGRGRVQEKHPHPKQLETKWKSGKSRRDRTKKGERRGLKFH